MSEESRVMLSRREWLNGEEQGGNAFICTVIEQVRDGYDPYGDITISDCNRQVTLEFGLYDEQRRKNSLDKIRCLVEMVQDFERNLYRAAVIAEENERKREADKKKKKPSGSRRRTR